MAKNLVIGYGNVGRLIASELKSKNEDVLVGRHSDTENSGEFMSVVIDLLNQDDVVQKVKGSGRVFVTTGLPYKLSVWQKQWPVIIENIIIACKATKAKLIFIDNVYSYGPAPLQAPMTEDHPRQPVSEKGKVRLQLVEKLERAMKDGLDVLIVRCADFYGPHVSSSGVTMAIEAAKKRKTAYFIGDPSTKHSYSYVPDIARATALLALDKKAYKQTWHVPTGRAIQGDELMAIVERTLEKRVNWSVVRGGKLSYLAWFAPVLRELKEMMYQFDYDYVFDCSKFKKAYPDFVITDYTDGIRATIEAGKE